MIKLSPSQEKAKNEISNKIANLGRPIVFLIGKEGVGKTTLLQHLANVNGTYVSILDRLQSSDDMLNDNLNSLLESLLNEIDLDWAYIDNIDPLFFKYDFESVLETNIIPILRRTYSKKIVIASSYLYSDFINLVENQPSEVKSSVLDNTSLTSDNLVCLDFQKSDSDFLLEEIREREIGTANLENFYDR